MQAALAHKFDQQILRKVLIFNIGVCIMEAKWGRMISECFLNMDYLTLQYC